MYVCLAIFICNNCSHNVPHKAKLKNIIGFVVETVFHSTCHNTLQRVPIPSLVLGKFPAAMELEYEVHYYRCLKALFVHCTKVCTAHDFRGAQILLGMWNSYYLAGVSTLVPAMGGRSFFVTWEARWQLVFHHLHFFLLVLSQSYCAFIQSNIFRV